MAWNPERADDADFLREYEADPANSSPETCPRCDGRGWVGQVKAGQFAYIGRMAMEGRLPTVTCSRCNGTGRAPA